jgi:hypothetical protein
VASRVVGDGGPTTNGVPPIFLAPRRSAGAWRAGDLAAASVQITTDNLADEPASSKSAPTLFSPLDRGHSPYALHRLYRSPEVDLERTPVLVHRCRFDRAASTPRC